MINVELIVSIFTGGLIAGLFSTYQSNKKIKLEVITNKRKKWRDTMRFLSKEMVRASLRINHDEMKIIYHQFKVRLNPNDDEDLGLLESAKILFDNSEKRKFACIELDESVEVGDEVIDEFTTRVALLLKHDWERAKCESAPWWHLKFEPSRIKYCDLIEKKKCNAVNCFFEDVKKLYKRVVVFLRCLIVVSISLSISSLAIFLVILSFKFLKLIWCLD